MTDATIELNASGAILRISELPRRVASNSGVPELLRGADGPLSTADIQLLEETEYAYSIEGTPDSIEIEPVELFSPSETSGRAGRLRTGRSTGTVEAKVRSSNGLLVGRASFEVRSRKLEYLSEYRWMLQRIAAESAEAVQAHFAPSALGRFQPQNVEMAETLYQRFAFVQSLIESKEFDSALQLVLNQPHRSYTESLVEVDPRRGVRLRSRTARALARPGPRGEGLRHGPAALSTLPVRLEAVEHEDSFDTVPNQFVKHVLESWSALAADVEAACQRRSGPAARRGEAEAGALGERLRAVLRSPVFRNVGLLQGFPSTNTVLQRRAGYRDVLHAFLLSDTAAKIDWDGGEAVFGAGLRDVATLYEYWVFLELARIIGELPGIAVDKRSLFKQSKDRLSLELKQGRSLLLKGEGPLRGRRVSIDLWYNRSFRHGESWTEPMRPDCSLRITVKKGGHEHQRWMHFDAKYRVNSIRQLFNVDDTEIATTEARPVSADLLKMHAYRDALRRTTAAYVLYPGLDEAATQFTQYHELLPGLGAFVLRPSETGEAGTHGALALRSFIFDAIDHVAASGTDEERASYWADRVYKERRGSRLQQVVDDELPAADTKVILGFVRSEQHLDWIRSTHLYNMRADERIGSIGLDSPELAASLVCLYTESSLTGTVFRSGGTFVVRTGDELAALGYPSKPSGRLYCCPLLGDEVVELAIAGGDVRHLARLGRPDDAWGAPCVVTLDELLRAGD